MGVSCQYQYRYEYIRTRDGSTPTKVVTYGESNGDGRPTEQGSGSVVPRGTTPDTPGPGRDDGVPTLRCPAGGARNYERQVTEMFMFLSETCPVSCKGGRNPDRSRCYGGHTPS